MARCSRPLVGALLGLLAVAAPATAESDAVTARTATVESDAVTARTAAPGTRIVTARTAVARPCHRGVSSSRAGRALLRTRATARGLVSVRLHSRADWDLGVFGARGRLVAGSASFGGNELASGFVRRGERLTVQACRFRGGGRTARVVIGFTRVPKARVERISVLDVVAPRQADRQRLQALGLDLTERADADSVEVLARGRADLRALRRAGFGYTVRVADLAARTRAQELRDRARARQGDAASAARASAASKLPSGRTGYRRLPDYELELKRLAMRYPSLARPLTLRHRSVLGRDVNGIEVSTGAQNTADGKPVFLIMGLHHAREWPSAELTLEFAYDLLRGYGRDARTTRLLRETRTIVVPVVNPDGFNVSREAAFGGDFSLFDYEMKRKNCGVSAHTPNRYASGACDDNGAGRLRGTDPNRNYGGLWGGGGASVHWAGDTYRGDRPFSEPEVQNIRELISSRQVTNLITNHSYSNLVLRPPGTADFGFPLDEPLYRSLGDSLAARNGYASKAGFALYDTTGSAEDWSFWTTGGLAFTFEIGGADFHPPFGLGVEAEYLGLAPAAGAGKGGNREAFFTMLEATADASLHSVIEGTAPPGSTLRLSKRFQTATSPVWRDDLGGSIGDPLRFTDTLSSELRPAGPSFAWHVNPSTRPLVAGRHGRAATGPPQERIDFQNPLGIPAENPAYPGGPVEELPFTVRGPADGVDNGRMSVHLEWSSPDTDWDLYVIGPDGEVVAQSTSFGGTAEDATLLDPPPGGYRLHVVNYDQVMRGPDDWLDAHVSFRSPSPRIETGAKESWTLTCTGARGRVRATRQVIVDRGGRAHVGDACAAKGLTPQGSDPAS